MTIIVEIILDFTGFLLFWFLRGPTKNQRIFHSISILVRLAIRIIILSMIFSSFTQPNKSRWGVFSIFRTEDGHRDGNNYSRAYFHNAICYLLSYFHFWFLIFSQEILDSSTSMRTYHNNKDLILQYWCDIAPRYHHDFSIS